MKLIVTTRIQVEDEVNHITLTDVSSTETESVLSNPRFLRESLRDVIAKSSSTALDQAVHRFHREGAK